VLKASNCSIERVDFVFEVGLVQSLGTFFRARDKLV
jgi:hypothetical protein